MRLYFHGTEKKNLEKILKRGFKTESGRATFTMNPQYTFSFSTKKTWGTKKKIEDYSSIIKEGMMLVFKVSNNHMKVAIDSNLVFLKDKRIITGWPNRFKTEQFGYFVEKKDKKIIIPKKYLFGAYSYNKELIDEIKNISEDIILGRINKVNILKHKKILTRIFSNKLLWLISPKNNISDLVSEIIDGMIRNLVLREIRQTYLSKMNYTGWKIENYGDHPVKLKNEKQIKESMENMKKLIKQKFISKDLRIEFDNLSRIK